MRARQAEPSTGREIPALIACAVWLLGFEAAPVLHVAQHAELAPHTHGAARVHRHDGGEEHSHERDGDDPEHGEGSLLHRGLAAHAAPPALPPVDPPWWITVVPRFEAPVPPDAVDGAPPRARGPPERVTT